jgi:glutathione-specific gamma-glutamylcyclotransferase
VEKERIVRWVFAYGSLVFRPGFSFVRREVACIDGFERRFFQGSDDHRGTPEAPGRVVTLVPTAGARCWGVAFGLAVGGVDAVLDRLDFRERGGYSRLELPLLARAGHVIAPRGLVYVANPDNPSWLGDAPFESMARQVRECSGPSGKNSDYVVGLARALDEMGVDDAHVFTLADHVDPSWRGKPRLAQAREPERATAGPT